MIKLEIRVALEPVKLDANGEPTEPLWIAWDCETLYEAAGLADLYRRNGGKRIKVDGKEQSA